MAAPKENLMSLGQLTGTERNTFTKQRYHCVKNRPVLLSSHQHFRATQLQKYWQELTERELRAQQHNRELLQQFEKAQDTLKEMLARNATMKTIRMEYEQYLEERSPHWQQQLKEKTQLAQRMRMEDCLRSCIKIMGEERVTKSSEDRHSYSQGPSKKPQEVATTQEHNSQNIHSDYNQDGSSYLPYIQSSWLTHPQSQTARFPMRMSCQPQSSSHTPRSFLPHPHPFMLNRFTSTPGHHHPWPRQDPPGWSSLQSDFWAAGAAGLPSGSEAVWGQLYTEEPPPESRVSQVVAQEDETNRAPSSKSERGGGSMSSRLSQELDIKPVRLSSGHAESSESGRDSSHVIREKRKKKERRGRLQCTSSEKERHRSQESSRTSSAIIIASVAAVQSCESDASSGKCTIGRCKKRWRSGGRVAQSPRSENMAKERTRSKEDDSGSQKETSQCASGESGNQMEESTSGNAGTQSADDKSEKCREELGGISLQLKNGAGDEKEEQEYSSEQCSAEEKDVEEDGHENHQGCGDNAEKKNSQKDDKQDQGVEEENAHSEEKENSPREEKDDEEDYVFARKETVEEEETGAEEEMEEQKCEDKDDLKNENCENRSSASSQDEQVEDESGQEKDKMEDEEESAEEGEEEEEQRSENAGEPEEQSNSEDSIISPQENGTHTPEEAAEDDDNEKKRSETESSDGDDSNDFSEEDDIENLLAPQEQTKKKEEKDMKAAENPKAVCDNMKIFQVEDDRSTKTDQSDSDEFDNFYD